MHTPKGNRQRPYPREMRRSNGQQSPLRLTAEQLREFLARGFLQLDSQLPPTFHRHLFERLSGLDEATGHFGNNILPLVPELAELFRDSLVVGALQSVLGPHYLMHPHRALHSNPTNSEPQPFHKDSYWGHTRRVRNHRPWWVMLMYYPQDTPVYLGPTSVMDGSQHFHQRPEYRCREVAASGDAGRLLLIHYDIWHRKMKNLRDVDRYMVKFEFTRLVAPTPSTRKTKTRWQVPRERPGQDLRPVWRSNWHWLAGESQALSAQGKLTDWLVELDAIDEARGINAGYFAASHGKTAVTPLLEALASNASANTNIKQYADDGSHWQQDHVLRNAAHGLVTIGRPALAGLARTLSQGNARARKHAAFVLGEIGTATAASQQALFEGLQDADVHVRIAAVEALGIQKTSPAHQRAVGAALTRALEDGDSEVRFCAALALVRLVAGARLQKRQLGLDDLVEPLGEALYDANRYVAAHAADALERIGTRAALDILLPYLRTARWCAQSSNERPF